MVNYQRSIFKIKLLSDRYKPIFIGGFSGFISNPTTDIDRQSMMSSLFPGLEKFDDDFRYNEHLKQTPFEVKQLEDMQDDKDFKIRNRLHLLDSKPGVDYDFSYIYSHCENTKDSQKSEFNIGEYGISIMFSQLVDVIEIDYYKCKKEGYPRFIGFPKIKSSGKW